MLDMILSSILMCFMLMILTMMWSFWTSRKKFLKSREKSSPFECGFDPKDKSRIPFSIRFFLIMMMFLMFDVEISMLLELPYQLDFDNFKGRAGIMLVVWMLLMGTIEEWRRGALKWKV